MSSTWQYPYDTTATDDSFDKYIESSEKEAMDKFKSAVENIQGTDIPEWFIRLLENTIMPPLAQIGFDERVQRALFMMSAPAWESICPVGNGALWFHPSIINNISEIRKGILLKEERKLEHRHFSENTDPYAQWFILKRSMDPTTLFSALEEISTPWIIIPRAYNCLDKTDGNYLIGYIKFFLKEKEPAFLRILVRIIIEFVGNYTIKFISDAHPREKVVEALFNGYAALFWKNLRCPPDGLEHLLVFKNFFRWADRCLRISNYPSQGMAETAEDMKRAVDHVFPTFNAFGLANINSDPIDKFLITLRHGNPGIETVLNYFSPAPALIRNITNGRIPYVNLPGILQKLLKKIQESYEKETPKTQGFLSAFLYKLKTAYDLIRIREKLSETSLPDGLRFAGARVQSMIQGLSTADTQ